MMNNAHCFKCKKDYVVKDKIKKCPECGDKLKILGKVMGNLSCSNGVFRNH